MSYYNKKRAEARTHDNKTRRQDMQMKSFCFTVDDNIRFLKELTNGRFASIFDHSYLAMYNRLHKKYGVKVQLNLFYETNDFDLSMMTSKYSKEWRENADWLKMSFHSRKENVLPYQNSSYNEMYEDCLRVQNEILRFAAKDSLARTTTVHYCQCTKAGVQALADNGVRGLLGLFGDSNAPQSSYSLTEDIAREIRNGETLSFENMWYSAIDIILNLYSLEEIRSRLSMLLEKKFVKIMIHEQYFYRDYKAYQENFEEKAELAVKTLTGAGFTSTFFENMI